MLLFLLVIATINLALGYLTGVILREPAPPVPQPASTAADTAARTAPASQPQSQRPAAPSKGNADAAPAMTPPPAQPADQNEPGDGDEPEQKNESEQENEREAELESVPDALFGHIDELTRQLGDALCDVDLSLRTAADAHELAALKTHGAQLEATLQKQLPQLSSIIADLTSFEQRVPDLTSQCQHVHSVLDALSYHVNDAVIALNDDQLDGDEQYQQRLIDCHRRLFSAYHQSRSQLEEPVAALAANMAANQAPNAFRGRLQLDQALSSRRAEDAQQSLVASMFDLDNLAELNERHGVLLVNKLLDRITATIAELCSDSIVISRLASQQFVAVWDCPAEEAAQHVERVRQTIEQTEFLQDELQVHATLSAAVVPGQADESTDDLLYRLRTTLKEAKSYGRNRTFLHDEDGATPVVPPKLPVKRQSVALA